jgi:predicted RNA binding protein YcfA (HicA-like mRNA interferase family)
MGDSLPAISGPELIKLLKKDGWIEKRNMAHGIILIKYFQSEDRTRVTTIPTKRRSLPRGTLMDILGSTQTCLGRKGLTELMQR